MFVPSTFRYLLASFIDFCFPFVQYLPFSCSLHYHFCLHSNVFSNGLPIIFSHYMLPFIRWLCLASDKYDTNYYSLYPHDFAPLFILVYPTYFASFLFGKLSHLCFYLIYKFIRSLNLIHFVILLTFFVLFSKYKFIKFPKIGAISK